MTPKLPRQPQNLFPHDGKVYQDVDTDDEKEYDGPWPVVVLLKALDTGNGRGWGAAKVEKHGTVLHDYLHDVSHEDETYAVLVEVPTAKDLHALDRAGFEFCGDEVPDEL